VRSLSDLLENRPRDGEPAPDMGQGVLGGPPLPVVPRTVGLFDRERVNQRVELGPAGIFCGQQLAVSRTQEVDPIQASILCSTSRSRSTTARSIATATWG
jgi:hypothetical protein